MPAVDLLSGITGLNNTGTYPPDTGIAVGSTYAVETVNQSLAIYKKSTGAKFSSEDFLYFFPSTYYYGSNGFFDPQVMYDDTPGFDRFVIAVATTSSISQGSGTFAAYIDFAVSNSSDPTGTWTFQQIEVDQAGANWVDNGKLGYNANAWVYSGNRIGNTSTGSALLSIQKSSITNPTWTKYGPIDISGQSIIPARMHATASGTMWFVESTNGGGSSVNVLETTNVLSSNPTFTTTSQPTSTYSPATVNQPGGAIIFPGSSPPFTYDSRTEGVDWNNNNMVAAWNSQFGSSSDAAAFWVEFNTGGSQPTLTQQAFIHPASGISTSMPAVAIDANGDIGLTFIQSSMTPMQYPSTYITGRLASDNPNTMEGSQLVSTGVGNANVSDNRIGDYAGVSLDPSSSNTFWAANEYGLSTSMYTWGTAIAQFQVLPPVQTVGIFDPNNAIFHLSDILGNPGSKDYAFQYGGAGWEPIAGNFSGSGQSTPGLFDPNNAIFHISKVLGNPGSGDIAFQYGGTGWIPIAGNFFNVGYDTVGIFDPNNAVFHLSHTIGNPGSGDYAFQYGGAGWIPIVGDFFGLGYETVGVFDPNNAVFHLSNVLGNPGPNDYAFQWGYAGWKPVGGDFTGTSKATVGLFDPTNAIFHISEILGNPGAGGDIAFPYGLAGWAPIAGKWELPQLAAGGEARIVSGAAPLTESQLQTEVQVALNLLASDGVNSSLLAWLGSLQFSVGQLPAGYLGLSEVAAGTVEISADAAGYGWFVDANPLLDQAFINGAAQPGSAAANRMDLLTVVLHEMGHFDGWTELDPTTHPDALMALTLGTGERRIQALDAVFAAGL